MLEKTRQSMAVLKERVTTTHIEMERREVMVEGGKEVMRGGKGREGGERRGWMGGR